MLELNVVEPLPKSAFSTFFQKIKKLFSRDTSSVAILCPDPINTTKFIENDNIQLVHVEETCEPKTAPGKIKKCRSEIFNNSENNLIVQKNVMLEKLELEIEEFQKQLDSLKRGNREGFLKFAGDHIGFLIDQKEFLKSLGAGQENLPGSSNPLPYSSTPYRETNKAQQLKKSQSNQLAASIHGTEVNKTYLEENRNDYSVSDLSTWFQTKSNDPVRRLKDLDELKTLDDVALETKMNNFRNLLLKVKEIIDGKFFLF
jgi:hypothetical protein